jgi:virginiamycin B lyase
VTVPTPNSHPLGIATASDNNVYITEFTANKIARVSNLGNGVSEAALGSVGPYLIVRGPDGNLWFTEYYASKIGQFSPSSFSQIGEFPTLTPNATPAGIAVGVDGALWFTENTADKIGRITTTGVVTEYASPVRGLQLNGIAVAPNGSLWFTEAGVNKIGELVY